MYMPMHRAMFAEWQRSCDEKAGGGLKDAGVASRFNAVRFSAYSACASESGIGSSLDRRRPEPENEVDYFREPTRRPFSRDCRSLAFFRFGLLITNVPLPRFSALYSLSTVTLSSANLAS